MNNVRKLIIGSLAILGLTAAGYRTYEIRKLRKELKQDEVIDIEPEVIEEMKGS